MRYAVKEAFSSQTRRFSPDMEIDESELDGPVAAERWVEMGKLSPAPAPELPLDLPTDQARLKLAWQADRSSGVPKKPGEWPILMTAHDLYGTVISDDGAAVLEVRVFGEDRPRRYPSAAMDEAAGTVSGEMMNRRADRDDEKFVTDAPAAVAVAKIEPERPAAFRPFEVSPREGDPPPV